MNIKSFNKSFTTQQNFTYGVMLIVYQSLTHQLADVLDTSHIDDTDLLVRGVNALSQSYSDVGIQRILEGTPRIASIRKYLSVMKNDSTSENVREPVRAFRDYLIRTGVEAAGASAIANSVYRAVCYSTCTEGSQVIYDKVSAQFNCVPSIKLRRK